MSGLQFLGYVPIGVAVGLMAAGLAWFLYRRELQHASPGRAGRWLPALRSSAVFLIVMMLAEPVVQHRALDAEPGRLLIVLDDSQSMSLADQVEPLPASQPRAETQTERSRFFRAAQRLLDLSGGLSDLSQAFDLTLVRAGAADFEVLWRSRLIDATPVPQMHGDDLPKNWRPLSWSNQTMLGDVLRRGHAVLGGDLHATGATRAIVLVTDGQSNAGENPLSVARLLGESKVPVFTIGFGSENTPPDLAIVQIVYPESLFRTDTLQGKLQFRETLPIGTPFQARITHGKKVLWHERLVASGSPLREIEYSFPIESVVHDELLQSSADVEHARLSIELQVELITDAADVYDANNRRAMHLNVATQTSRILLLDGRSRWETRYLKNLFGRDPFWHIDTLIHAETPLSGDAAVFERFPKTREALMDYNLVILGDVPAQAFTPSQRSWLAEYVEQGGGLVIVDGARGYLRSQEYAALSDLLPVRWVGKATSAVASTAGNLPKSVALDSAGNGLAALQLTATNSDVQAGPRSLESVPAATLAENQEVWKALPPLNFVSRVEKLAGSETLVNAVSSLETTPLLVSRRYGAGRVLFVATDETWRWRYKVADRVHQRLWNQIARWVQRQPLSVRNEFLALDSGAARVAPGEPVEIRCRLRDSSARPAGGRSVVAVVQSQLGIVAKLPMLEESGLAGSYQVTTAELPEGEYRVTIEAEGFSEHSLEIYCQVTVEAPIGEEVLQLSCNTRLLQQISEESGGQFLEESQFMQLSEVLEPLGGAKLVESATLIWQSYWWFSVVMGLLITEWIIRKRVGLV